MDQYEINKDKLEGNMFDIGEEVKETFKVDSDSAAEWSLQKIKEHQEEHERIKRLCESMINEYKERMIENDKELERNTGWFKSQLRNYFDSVPHKSTKTQEAYKLGLGKLVLKKQSPEAKRDDVILLQWIKDNGYTHIKTKESVDWAEFKKELKQVDNMYVTANGEIVEGVTLLERDDKFEVIV